MTKDRLLITKKRSAIVIPMIFCLTLTVVMLLFGEAIKESIISGIRLSVLNIIPTLFPFFVLSDYWSSAISLREDNMLAQGFRRAFKINGQAVTAFFSGIFCGFPLGVKTAADLYRDGSITKDELTRLSGFINNPSLAFVISGVGMGMYGSLKYGIVLYISVLISAVLVGVLFAKNSEEIKISTEIPRQKFDIVASIKSAGLSSVAISSYIIFFSGALGLLLALTKNEQLSTIFSPFFEVGNATSMIAKNALLPPLFASSLTAFSLAFSGFSVHLQTFAFLPREVSKSKYLLMKLLQGLLASLIILPIMAVLW